MITKMPPRSKNPMKTLTNQLRSKGVMMVAEPSLDPTLGAVYTFRSVKPGMSNSDVAYKLYYASEVAKWSPTRRKAIDKAAAKAKKQEEEAERRIKEESASAASSEKESVAGSGSGSGSE